MRAWLRLSLLCICACGTPAPPLIVTPIETDGGARGARGAPSDASKAPAADRDHDGVCDATELMLGSNPDAADSDNDGFPDFVEVSNGFDPTDPSLPGPDQVGYLAAASKSSSYDFDVRSTVDSSGEGQTGFFDAYPTVDPHQLTANDFFVSGIAVDAQPPDNVRGIVAASERFTSVTGHTRLGFRLHFDYHVDVQFDCAEGFAFSYAVKSDLGKQAGQRDYLLVVTAKGSMQLTTADYCLPATCL
ncbi:MAG TPA: thrombospondin type 3 repeat-containing protein [Polyangiales bacterium]